MTKYGKKVSDTVERAAHDPKRGDPESGRSGKAVKSRGQAIACGRVFPDPARVPRGRPAAKRRTVAQRASDGV